MSQEKRIIEFDILRSVAILMIMVSHLSGQDVLHLEEFYRGRYVIIAMVFFFYLLGFFMFKYPCNTYSELKRYIKSKFVRIIGLYWILLLAQWIFYNVVGFQAVDRDLSLINLFQQAVGLHIFRSVSAYPAMWFMGTLILYLLLYALVSFVLRKRSRIIIALLVLVAPLYILRAQRYIVTDNYSYWIPFVAGILAGYAYSAGVFTFKKRRVPRWLDLISYGAFTTYLTHLMLWRIYEPLFDNIGVTSDIQFALLGIPLAIAVGYLVQYIYDNVIVYASKKVIKARN